MFETHLIKHLIPRRREETEGHIDDARLTGLINEARTQAERVAIGREARERLRFIRRNR